jgi:hypothetical protein
MKTISALFLPLALLASLSAKAETLSTDCLNAIEVARIDLGSKQSAVINLNTFQNDLHLYDQMSVVVAKQTNPDALKLYQQALGDQWQQVMLDLSTIRPVLSGDDLGRIGRSCGLAD